MTPSSSPSSVSAEAGARAVGTPPGGGSTDPGSIELHAQIAVLAAAVEELWRLQNEAGLTTRVTRKHPNDILRSCRRWQRELASVETSANVQPVVADGIAG